MTQKITLRPMTETPERWPVVVFDQEDSWVYTATSISTRMKNGCVGWLYPEELTFEVKK